MKDFFKREFKSDDKLLDFFKNPDFQLKLEIEKNINKKYHEIIKSEFFIEKIKPFYDSLISNFAVYKNDIEIEYIRVKELAENQFIQECEKEVNDIIENNLEGIRQYNYKKDCPYLQFGSEQNWKNERHLEIY